MTRDHGWRFLSIGRHLERLSFVASTLDDVARGRRAAGAGAARVAARSVRQPHHLSRAPHAPARVGARSSTCCSSIGTIRGRRCFSSRKLAKHVRCCRAPDRRSGRRSSPISSSCAGDRRPADAAQGELFGDGVRRGSVLVDLPAPGRCGCRTRLTLRYFSHIYDVAEATRPSDAGSPLPGRARDALSAPGPRVDVAARGVSQAAALAAPDAARHDLTIEPAPDELMRADRLLRQLAASVRDPDAVSRDARRQPQPGRRARRGAAIDPDASPPWEDGARRATQFDAATPLDADVEFRYALAVRGARSGTRGVRPREFSRPGGRLLAAAIDLMHRIHEEFRFDPGATTITTPVTRVLADRHGVCQDFAHLQIGCLRVARSAGPLRQRLSADRSAARAAAAGRRRRVARLAVGRAVRDTAGSISIRPTTCCPTSAT